MYVVISDLDGTILDHTTYSFREALPGLELLAARAIPLVLCTSKTRAETEYWRRLLHNEHPFIVENGGAVFIPPGYFCCALPEAVRRDDYLVIQLGASHRHLVRTLKQASASSGCAVRAFHEMSPEAVARLCGLSPDLAVLALKREFDEPFVVLDDTRRDALLAEIEKAGMRWTRGGRLYHVIGGGGKAAAVKALLDLYRVANPNIRSIGLGDGLNDAVFLNAVDIPILIRTPWVDKLEIAVPRGRTTDSPGPRGWTEALLKLLP
jgi:mannosyl-3-phosphoglycerate phosphatase family protein